VKNKLTDLNNHLFAQLERLGEEGMTPEQIEQDAKRAKAMVDISAQIVQAQSLTLKAVDIVAKHGDRFARDLPMLAAGGGQTIEASSKPATSDASE
jgi:hypothetical protein